MFLIPDKPRDQLGLKVEIVVIRPDGSDGSPVVIPPDEKNVCWLKAKDIVRFRIKVDKEAYVGMWTMEADGKILQLFPNGNEPNNRFLKGEEREVPTTRLRATESKGLDRVWILASSKLWDNAEGRRAEKAPWLLFQTEREQHSLKMVLRGLDFDSTVELSDRVLQYKVRSGR